MRARHFELLVEEPSMEAFLHEMLPRLLGDENTFHIHVFRGKRNLLDRLKSRLCAYQRWLPLDWRLVVVVDRDDDDCQALKQTLDDAAREAGLRTRSQAGAEAWRIVNRIAIEELEAWYFGDWQAVRSAYPRVSPNIPRQARYRDPDAIKGGTWEAFERILKKHGYFSTGLRKVEAARAIATHTEPARNRSRSFAVFREALAEAVA